MKVIKKIAEQILRALTFPLYNTVKSKRKKRKHKEKIWEQEMSEPTVNESVRVKDDE